jgi:hypothetical protein
LGEYKLDYIIHPNCTETTTNSIVLRAKNEYEIDVKNEK